MTDDDSQRKSKQPEGPGSGSSIAQIENLQLPKRSERRRTVYISEQLTCWLRVDEHELRVAAIDLSSRGIAVIEAPAKLGFPYIRGQRLELAFDKGSDTFFTVAGVISNVSEVRFGQKKFKRLGVSFSIPSLTSKHQFDEAIGGESLACCSNIRPQASCADPFFFSEIMLFQVEGFTAEGIELVVSERCKSLLPNQPLDLDIYMPGRGSFVVPVVVSSVQLRMKGNRFRVFVRYQKPPVKFLEAVSEHLIMFGDEVTPVRLRGLGFKVGELTQAFEVSYASLSRDIIISEKLQASGLGLPSAEEASEHQPSPFSRSVRCKLGPHLVAVLGLTFVEGELSRSRFHALGYEIEARVLAAGHVELSGFFISPKVELVDFLLPLLRNIVKIAVQAQGRYILLECSEELRPILQRMGFRNHGRAIKRSPHKGARKETSYLVELAVTEALLNQNKFLPENVWRKVYKELFEYFKQQSVKNQKARKATSGKS